MATVVLVHGIAQEQEGPDRLESKWLPALAGGMRLAGFAALADRLWRDRAGPRGIDARMAFYGHLFLRPGQQGMMTGEPSSQEQAVSEQLALEWLQHAARRASRATERATAERELAYVCETIGAEEAGRGAVVRSAIASLSRLRWFAPFGFALAERFVERALVQVTRYLTDEAIRRAALQAVLGLTGPDTRAIIGHSLGSVIAYEAAHTLAYRLPLLVTLGSPLGIDNVVYPRLRPQPPTFPPQVRRWINITDRDDFVAAEPDLTSKFSAGRQPDASFESSFTVDNGAQPHSAEFYLGKIEIGRQVGEVLNGMDDSPREWKRGSSA